MPPAGVQSQRGEAVADLAQGRPRALAHDRRHRPQHALALAVRARAPACCMDPEFRRTRPNPIRDQAMRTEIGRPSSSMRLRAWTATSTSVARRSSLRERSASPITCFQRAMAASIV